VETIAPSTLATTTGSLEIPSRLPASRVTLLGRMRWSQHMASQRCKSSRPKESAKALKVISQLARM
jgi:hypothetical protein